MKTAVVRMNLAAVVILLTMHFTTVSAQARYVGKAFMEYSSDVPWEDIFVHTDREKYIAGENIWLKVYSYDRKSMKPSSLSRIAYVELLNYDNRPVVQKRILLDAGSGPGQLTLPDTLSSGIYTLRAYTAWMKNFLPAGSFVKEIGIYNAINLHASVKKPVKNISEKKQQVQSGLSLKVDNTRQDILQLSLLTTADFRKANGEVCNILIHTRGNLNLSESIPLTGDVTDKIISKKMLAPGINHISMFDASGRAILEKFIYTASGENTLKVESGSVFGKREKITFSVESAGSNIREMSTAVSPVTGEDYGRLDDFLIFGTEFGEELTAKLASCNLRDYSTSAIDSILADARSSWIDWDKITGKNTFSIKYLPENTEHFLTGKLVSSEKPGDYVIMSVPGKQAIFSYSTTNAEGEFSFGIPVDEEIKEIIIQPDDMKGAVNVVSPFAETYTNAGHLPAADDVPGYIPGWGINFQVQKIYGTITAEGTLRPLITSPDKLRFYGKPDIQLLLADYIKLPLMEEVFFELLPGTYLRRKRTGYEIFVTDPVTNAAYEYPTTLFVDGVRIDDAAAIAGIDPELVEQIDVLRDRYLVGDYLFHGIVNIITKAGDFTAVSLPEYAVRSYYRVIDPVEKFSSPVYENQDQKMSRIPDFRNTLWWNPSVNGLTGAEFWSSDVPGEYRIIVNGIASDGSPVSTEKVIRIE